MYVFLETLGKTDIGDMVLKAVCLPIPRWSYLLQPDLGTWKVQYFLQWYRDNDGNIVVKNVSRETIGV